MAYNSHHSELTLVPEFELAQMVQMSLAEEMLIHQAKIELLVSPTLNPGHLERRSAGSVG